MAGIGAAKNRGDVDLEQIGFRLSWGAVFAGFVVATMLYITLTLFGIAIGFSTWEVGDPAADLGSGVGIWTALSALIALFIGGLTTGRLAGVVTRGDGAVHGVVMWGISTIANLLLLASGLSVLLGGAFGIVGRTVAATAGGVVSGVGQVGAAAIGQAGTVDPDQLQAEIESILRQTGAPELQPEAIQEDLAGVRDTAATGVSNEALARDLADVVQQRAGAVDREAIINVVVARTGMSRAEAEQVATRVESATAAARQQITAGAQQVGQQVSAAATDAASTATEVLGEAAWWTLLALGLGVAAAAGGAAMTARQ